MSYYVLVSVKIVLLFRRVACTTKVVGRKTGCQLVYVIILGVQKNDESES